jgi:hypothetical protein
MLTRRDFFGLAAGALGAALLPLAGLLRADKPVKVVDDRPDGFYHDGDHITLISRDPGRTYTLNSPVREGQALYFLHSDGLFTIAAKSRDMGHTESTTNAIIYNDLRSLGYSDAEIAQAAKDAEQIEERVWESPKPGDTAFGIPFWTNNWTPARFT